MFCIYVEILSANGKINANYFAKNRSHKKSQYYYDFDLIKRMTQIKTNQIVVFRTPDKTITKTLARTTLSVINVFINQTATSGLTSHCMWIDMHHIFTRNNKELINTRHTIKIMMTPNWTIHLSYADAIFTVRNCLSIHGQCHLSMILDAWAGKCTKAGA